MRSIPRTALLLGLAGLIPFVAAAVLTLMPASFSFDPGIGPYRPLTASSGPDLMMRYGIVILAFMSGVLWGFGSRAEDHQGWYLTGSVLPALWAFFMVEPPATQALPALAAGFVAVYLLDLLYSRAGQTPAWWIDLRSLLSVVVLLCLGVGYYGG